MPRGQEERAREFYESVLGLRWVPKPDNLAARGGCWFEAAGAKVHLGVDDDFRPARRAHPGLLVDDLEDLRHQLGRADVPMYEDAPLEGYKRVHVEDPFGNRLELMELLPPPSQPVVVRALGEADKPFAVTLLSERWGSLLVHSRGRVLAADQLPALVAEQGGRNVGLATYLVGDDEVELVTLDALVPGRGTGSALLEAVIAAGTRARCRRLCLTTSNDNLDAIRFYQRRGLRLAAVHRSAIDRAREAKPQIPEVGCFGIAIHDEVELDMALD